jgi:hypothetical protein
MVALFRPVHEAVHLRGRRRLGPTTIMRGWAFRWLWRRLSAAHQQRGSTSPVEGVCLEPNRFDKTEIPGVTSAPASAPLSVRTIVHTINS